MTAPEPATAATTRARTAAAVPAFAVRSNRGGLVCEGMRSRLPSGGADTLGARVDAFFATHHGGPQLLAGALPFDRNAADHLFQPDRVHRLAAPGHPVTATPLTHAWRLRDTAAPTQYAAAVTRALALLAPTVNADTNATLRKVVLARTIELEADAAVDINRVAALLASSRHATAFNVQLPTRNGAGAPRHLVGASPELLVAKTGAQVHSYPLAGSIARNPDNAADQAAARALLQSDKDRREHQAVVEAVLDTLAPYCSRLPARPETIIKKADKLWHLGTPITGTLKNPATSSAELAAALHPTPAVCGLPRKPAYAAISELETFDRGFYAGAVGWTRANGDGEWHVAIRCAEIEAARVRLYAGAGIVPGSDPARETQETTTKFAVMLKALGIDTQQLQHVLETVA